MSDVNMKSDSTKLPLFSLFPVSNRSKTPTKFKKRQPNLGIRAEIVLKLRNFTRGVRHPTHSSAGVLRDLGWRSLARACARENFLIYDLGAGC